MHTLTSIDRSRAERYEHLLQQAEALFTGERDWLATFANAASLLYFSLEEINWAGFYLYKDEELVLGPFMGKPACIRIPLTKGVCGAAARTQQTQVVQDVSTFSDHIACDADTKAEIVIPLIKDGTLLGVLDIDSPLQNRFDELDQRYLEQFAKLIIDHIEWK
ncbi:GAF domain-containing protein [Mechercharimyces sp. CAU 1602]|uniref:GAF domain-containing protein n=1 Tax=Mechercharimyces sp. CAU 1602 TaxID=2973933 RepID=UPI002161878D|nr:GAF domain-containing protein [Mechercharimyces sp. CAU 1602]MCS1350133.1 GAF domain-containing protein [Mechercharimyces sp. CAU 1602]